MIKDFTTYISEGLFDRNQSEFVVRRTDKGIEQIYIPKTKNELYSYIDLDIEQAKKDGTYPNVNLNNIDVSELEDDALNDELKSLFGDIYKQINPDISNWNIKYIPNNFFDNNKQIKEFTIPNSVTSIGQEAFADCNNLTSVTIPNSVTSIKWAAFYGCTGLTYVTIPNSVTNIESGVFWGCAGLKSVVISNSVTNIGLEVFSGCTGLTSIAIPNNVISVEDYAFAGCTGLTSVTISKHCDIGTNSFPKDCKIIRKDD